MPYLTTLLASLVFYLPDPSLNAWGSRLNGRLILPPFDTRPHVEHALGRRGAERRRTSTFSRCQRRRLYLSILVSYSSDVNTLWPCAKHHEAQPADPGHSRRRASQFCLIPRLDMPSDVTVLTICPGFVGASGSMWPVKMSLLIWYLSTLG